MGDQGKVDQILIDSLKELLKKRTKYEKEVLESEVYKEELSNFHKSISHFNELLKAATLIGSSYPRFKDSSLLFQNRDQFLESTIAIMTLGSNGIRNPVRRELRYLLELSLHCLFVDQQIETSDIETKLIYLKRQVNTSSINQIDEIDFYLFKDEQLKSKFIDDFRDLYGISCTYVHSSSPQMNEMLTLKEKGISLGFETDEELKEIKNEVYSALSLVTVLIMHSLNTSLLRDIIIYYLNDLDNWKYSDNKYYTEIANYFN